jgi:hypothetical protein
MTVKISDLDFFRNSVIKKFWPDPLKKMEKGDYVVIRENKEDKEFYAVTVRAFGDQKTILCKKYFPQKKMLRVMVLYSSNKRTDGFNKFFSTEKGLAAASLESLQTLKQIYSLQQSIIEKYGPDPLNKMQKGEQMQIQRDGEECYSVIPKTIGNQKVILCNQHFQEFKKLRVMVVYSSDERLIGFDEIFSVNTKVAMASKKAMKVLQDEIG